MKVIDNQERRRELELAETLVRIAESIVENSLLGLEKARKRRNVLRSRNVYR